MFSFWKKEKQLTFNVVICLEKDGDGFYAHCPSLKGIHVDGTTKEEALENLKKVITLDPKNKEKAKKDKDFKNLWEDEEFKRLVE